MKKRVKLLFLVLIISDVIVSFAAFLLELFFRLFLVISEIHNPCIFTIRLLLWQLGLVQLILRNFVTFCIYSVSGMLTSFIRFWIYICSVSFLLCGCSLSFSVFFLLSCGKFLECYLIWLPVWIIYCGVMLLYFTFNFIYSVSLFKAQVLGKSDPPLIT